MYKKLEVVWSKKNYDLIKLRRVNYVIAASKTSVHRKDGIESHPLNVHGVDSEANDYVDWHWTHVKILSANSILS